MFDASPARQTWLVLDRVRLEPIGAARFLHPVHVVPRALERDRLAVSFEGKDVGGDPVEEPAIVRDPSAQPASGAARGYCRARGADSAGLGVSGACSASTCAVVSEARSGRWARY